MDKQQVPALDLQRISEESSKILQKFLNDQDEQLAGTAHITRAFMELSQNWMTNPERMIEMQMKLYQGYMELWSNMAKRMMGEEVEPTVTPERGDRRFNSEEWQNNVVFDYIKQSYLLTSKWVTENIQNTDGIDERAKEKVDFYTRQFLDAMSPSNFPLSNPEVLNAAIESKGETLIKGLKNLVSDLERGEGKLKVSMTDYNAFKIGENLATTEGEVVFRHDLFELIQYTPKTKQVYERPTMIVPPWINKFYILDLHPDNSFVKYSVEECGVQTFIMSWKNPDETYRDYSFEDYMKAVFDAMDVVLEITGQENLNAVGYCIGGTLLTSTLAVMEKKKDTRVNSATMFTTLIDFSDAGELGIFIDEEQVSNLEAKMQKRGYLDGSEMAGTFSMLRSNDLIWSFVVNNYLMGKDPFPFDILYWNDDSTRMPCAMHSYYLRNMYIDNSLIKKDKLKMCDQLVDIRRIQVPIYMVSGINDHITPWKSCYSALHMMKSKVRYVLTKAGHVAGIVNPPGNPKRSYWVGEDIGADADDWLTKAKQEQDSWWPDWKVWIGEQSGKLVDAPKLVGSKKHKAIEAAPGRYVTE